MTLPYAVGKIIDVIYSSHADGGDIKDTLVPICQVLGVIFFIGAAANFGRVYLIQTSGDFEVYIDLCACELRFI